MMRLLIMFSAWSDIRKREVEVNGSSLILVSFKWEQPPNKNMKVYPLPMNTMIRFCIKSQSPTKQAP